MHTSRHRGTLCPFQETCVVCHRWWSIFQTYPQYLLLSHSWLTYPHASWHCRQLSTHHPMVNCFPLIILFATQESYLFNANPMYSSVLRNRLHHSNANFRHPQRAFTNFRYITFRPFSFHMSLLYFRLTLHMISRVSMTLDVIGRCFHVLPCKRRPISKLIKWYVSWALIDLDSTCWLEILRMDMW